MAGKVSRTVDCLEVFCGTHELSNAFSNQGLEVLIYDIVLNPALNNIMSMIGLFLLVAAVLRVKAGGTAWWGIPCSPWVWLSRGSTGRSLFNVGGTAPSMFGCTMNWLTVVQH